MNLLRRPWAVPEDVTSNVAPLGPNDNFLIEGPITADKATDHARLLDWQVGGIKRALKILPYPKLGHSDGLPVVQGLPFRPKVNADPKSEAEYESAAALGRMNRVVARLQELETALDDPENVWDRLAAAWRRAENDQDPRMAEIVRQSNDVRPRLQLLEKRIRRVLRRARELSPLDRVQEMDRASMLWLVRQPGRNTAERAGSRQRVLATVRHESFDTLENRVLHSYVALAADVAREWLQEHLGASSSARYRKVSNYRKYCRRLMRVFADLGVARASPDIIPNYVLMDDLDYRMVYKAWIRLVRREREIDNLWAWQAQSWTDFCTLALTLSLNALDEAELVAQSPIIWNDEAVTGRWFEQDNPLAVFWLRKTGLIVEVQARPERTSTRQAASLAHVWLRVTDVHGDGMIRRIPVWTPHCFKPHDVKVEVQLAANKLQEAQRVPGTDIIKNGLVIFQAFGDSQVEDSTSGRCSAHGVSLDGSGASLAAGMNALGNYVQGLILESSR